MLTLLFTLLYYPSQQKRQISDAFEERLESTAELIALSTGVALGLDSYSAIQESFDWISNDSTIVYVLLYDSDGEEFAVYNPFKLDLDRSALLSHEDIYEKDAILHGSMPILFQGSDYGRLLIGYSLEPMYSRVKSNTKTSMFFGYLILVAGILMAWFLGRLITRPINELRNAAISMSEGRTDISLNTNSPDEVGDLARSFAVMVTNINEAVSSLEESEERFRNISESAADAIIGVNPQGKIAFWNKAASIIFGYSEKEALGGNMVDLLIPERFREEATNIALEYFQSSGDKALGKTVKLYGLRKTGEEFPAELHISRIQFGGDWHLTGILRDVTERYRSDQMRRVLYNIANAYSTSENLDALFKTIHSLLAKVISASNFYIAYYDKEKEQLSFPYYVDEVDSAPKPKPLGNGLTEYVLREVKSVFLNKEDIYAMSREGKIELIGTPSEQFVSVPLSIGKEVVGVVTVQSYNDPNLYNENHLALLEFVSGQIADAITKRRNADSLRNSERKYRQLSMELSQSNSMKDLLLDIITHDLKNPAGVIHGVVVMMSAENPDDEMVQMVRTSSDSLLKVIANATTLSKVSMDEEIKKETLDLYQLINDILGEFKSSLAYNEMEATNSIPADQKIHANPIIEEVFKNYISNAIKYAAHGKKIVVDCDESDGSLIIRVKDFGTTIDEEKRDAVFIRNLQLGKTAGRGLGLAIVKRIAEAHGGSVWVEPNTPAGNVFGLRLPV